MLRIEFLNKVYIYISINVCFHIIRNSYPTSFLAKNKENNSKPTSELDINRDETGSKDKNEDEANLKRRDLLMKLKSLTITEDDDNIDSDTDNEREVDNFDSDIDDILYDKQFSK